MITHFQIPTTPADATRGSSAIQVANGSIAVENGDGRIIRKQSRGDIGEQPKPAWAGLPQVIHGSIRRSRYTSSSASRAASAHPAPFRPAARPSGSSGDGSFTTTSGTAAAAALNSGRSSIFCFSAAPELAVAVRSPSAPPRRAGSPAAAGRPAGDVDAVGPLGRAGHDLVQEHDVALPFLDAHRVARQAGQVFSSAVSS